MCVPIYSIQPATMAMLTMMMVSIFLFFSFFKNSETMKLIRTTTDIEKFDSDRKEEKVSFVEVNESSLKNVRK